MVVAVAVRTAPFAGGICGRGGGSGTRLPFAFTVTTPDGATAMEENPLDEVQGAAW